MLKSKKHNPTFKDNKSYMTASEKSYNISSDNEVQTALINQNPGIRKVVI